VDAFKKSAINYVIENEMVSVYLIIAEMTQRELFEEVFM